MAGLKPVRMTMQTARRLALVKQHLAGRRPRSPSTAAIMSLMKDIRYLQLDPTTTVAPSHLIVLWSRLGAYRESDFERLLWKEKKLFEYWAHKASIVLTEDYPLYKERMKKFATGDGLWPSRLRQWMEENSEMRRSMLRELRSRGPLASGDFEERSVTRWASARKGWGLKESAWSSGRDVSRMLEFLYHQGTILVAGRQGRQKVWGLAEDFLPDWTPKNDLSGDEVEYIGAQLSLKGLGVATPKQIAWHFLEGRYPNLRKTLDSLQSDGMICRVDLEGARPNEKCFLHADDVHAALALAKGDWEPRTTLLSPFDNLVTDRERTLQFFDFFYRTEIYTPKALRKHGFYVMPILDGDRLVGRIDPMMDRREERLQVHSVHAEPVALKEGSVASRIAEAVNDLAGYLGAREVVYSSKVPDGWRGALK